MNIFKKWFSGETEVSTDENKDKSSLVDKKEEEKKDESTPAENTDEIADQVDGAEGETPKAPEQPVPVVEEKDRTVAIEEVQKEIKSDGGVEEPRPEDE